MYHESEKNKRLANKLVYDITLFLSFIGYKTISYREATTLEREILKFIAKSTNATSDDFDNLIAYAKGFESYFISKLRDIVSIDTELYTKAMKKWYWTYNDILELNFEKTFASDRFNAKSAMDGDERQIRDSSKDTTTLYMHRDIDKVARWTELRYIRKHWTWGYLYAAFLKAEGQKEHSRFCRNSHWGDQLVVPWEQIYNIEIIEGK